jgi:hypothetical protein
MARQTPAPDRLARRFDALGNDAHRIAECLARAHLVQERLRAAYAWDPRHHGELRSKAAAALAQGASGNAVVLSGGSEQRVIYRRRSAQVDAAREADERQSSDLALDAEDFDARLAQLKAAHAARGVAAAPPYARPTLREVDDAFVHETLLWHTDDRFEVQVRRWPKRSYDLWWAERRLRADSFQAAPVDGLKLPSITGRISDLTKAVGDSWASLSQVVPSARSGHTAVWTGSEMIIWGGADFGGTALGTGGRYNPATDSWGAATATSGAPSARRDHSAVWTGSEMIVWGGFDGSTVATGGRYDPFTDAWGAPIATTGAPAARADHTAVWTGSEMIVWGGFGSGLLNTGGRYDPAADTWGAATATSGAPSARLHHTAVWAADQMIVWGGFDSIAGELNNGARYDPVGNAWIGTTASSGAPSARDSHSAVWTGSQMIVWGGIGGGIHLNSGGRYDPVADTWAAATAVSSAPSARRQHSAIWTGSQMIVWGGFDGNNVLNTGGRYNPLSNSWGAATPTSAGVPSARAGHTAVWTGSEMIVWGGFPQLANGRRYDLAINRWSAPIASSGAPSGRGDHSAVWTGTEMIVWGGVSEGTPTATGGRYNPMTDSWAATAGGAPSPRWGHAAVWTGIEMIVWGGVGPGGVLQNTGGRYDPATDTWGAPTNTSGAPEARNDPSAAWSGSEMIIWGGIGNTLQNTGGRYDPVTNTWGAATATSGAPSARRRHSSVWTGSEMIVWGGLGPGGVLQNTGGRYDPVTNTWGAATSTSGAPSSREQHSAVWTGKAMLVWGGLTTGSLLSDMWLYFPYATASLTTLSSLAPSPSEIGAAVTATVRVASPDRAPVDGTVTVTASTGESCSDPTPQPVDALTVQYACPLSFASPGTREVRARFADSSSHDASTSAPVFHAVGERIFGSGFEGG